VVLFVEVPEGNSGGDYVGGVTEEEEEGVHEVRAENEVVCQFVNKDPLRVADECTNTIS